MREFFREVLTTPVPTGPELTPELLEKRAQAIEAKRLALLDRAAYIADANRKLDERIDEMDELNSDYGRTAKHQGEGVAPKKSRGSLFNTSRKPKPLPAMRQTPIYYWGNSALTARAGRCTALQSKTPKLPETHSETGL